MGFSATHVYLRGNLRVRLATQRKVVSKTKTPKTKTRRPKTYENEDLRKRRPTKTKTYENEDLRKRRPTKTKTPYENEDPLRKPFYFLVGNNLIIALRTNERMQKTNGRGMKYRNTYNGIISKFLKISFMSTSVMRQL